MASKPKLSIVYGVSCSGKLEVLRNESYNYVTCISAENFDVTALDYVDRINTFLMNYPEESILCEGYPIWENKMGMVSEKFDMDLIVAYAPIFLVKERRKQKGVDFDEQHYWDVYSNLESYIASFSKVRFINSGALDGYEYFSLKQFYETLKSINEYPTLIDEQKFIETLPCKSWGDKQYNDIELPHNLIRGVIDSQQTWNAITTNLEYDFSGKSVIDIGCHEGYHSFRCKQAGASHVIGIDINRDVLANAKKIAWLKQSPVDFLWRNISYHRLPMQAGVVICMNMIHYTVFDNALKNIFDGATEVIFQCSEQEGLSAVIDFASSRNYELVNAINDRPNRKLCLFTKR